MGLIFRKRVRFGPLAFNLSRRGVSTSVRAGRVTRNLTRRTTTVNLPGPFSWRFGGGRKRK